LESSNFNLKIREDAGYPNLFLIHTQDNSDFKLKLVRECNGIILDKNTFKIVCYTFDKCLDQEVIPDSLNKNELYIENAYEGTLIRLFYYENNWLISTKKCIDSSKARWVSKKSFLELFVETEAELNYKLVEKLNPNYCYSLLITHPENNIVVNYKNKCLHHISTRDMNTLNEIDINIGLTKPIRTFINNTNIDETMNSIQNYKEYDLEGFIFIDTNYNRWKIRTPIFINMRKLWGNTNNRLYRYLELRKDSDMLIQYLQYFNDDKDQFINYEYKIKEVATNILKFYVEKHITKSIDKVPYYYSKIIYKLHGDFYKTKIKTNINKVALSLLEIDAKQLCFIINHYEKNLISINNSFNDSFIYEEVNMDI
jgi:hypothetical protein